MYNADSKGSGFRLFSQSDILFPAEEITGRASSATLFHSIKSCYNPSIIGIYNRDCLAWLYPGKLRDRSLPTCPNICQSPWFQFIHESNARVVARCEYLYSYNGWYFGRSALERGVRCGLNCSQVVAWWASSCVYTYVCGKFAFAQKNIASDAGCYQISCDQNYWEQGRDSRIYPRDHQWQLGSGVFCLCGP